MRAVPRPRRPPAAVRGQAAVGWATGAKTRPSQARSPARRCPRGGCASTTATPLIPAKAGIQGHKRVHARLRRAMALGPRFRGDERKRVSRDVIESIERLSILDAARSTILVFPSASPGEAMAERLQPDICVIGAGSGGLSVAAAAAAFGVSVVLVEKNKMVGECVNTGCVPSKSLIAAAKHARAVAEARAFGVAAGPADIDFGKVHQHVHDVIAAIAPNDSKERFNGLGVRVIAGAARFKDRNTVAVGDEIEIVARRFVIATGSSPSLPPIAGLEAVPYLTNETVFDLTTRPQHLIVIGAGAVGLELAQAFRRLGAAVTVLEAGEPLAREDGECAAIVLDALAREGIDVRSNVAVTRVEGADAKIKVVVGEGDPAI